MLQVSNEKKRFGSNSLLISIYVFFLDKVKTKVRKRLGKYLASDDQQDALESTIVGAKLYKKFKKAKCYKSINEVSECVIEPVNRISANQSPDLDITNKLKQLRDVVLSTPESESKKIIDPVPEPRSLQSGSKPCLKRKSCSEMIITNSFKRLKLQNEPKSDAESLMKISPTQSDPTQYHQTINISSSQVEQEDNETLVCLECQPCDEETCLHLNHTLVVRSVQNLATHSAKTGHTRFQNVSSLFAHKPKILLTDLVHDKWVGHIIRKSFHESLRAPIGQSASDQ